MKLTPYWRNTQGLEVVRLNVRGVAGLGWVVRIGGIKECSSSEDFHGNSN